MSDHEQALTILYRGKLSSCNYDCSYCPFAKRHDSAQDLAEDKRALWRFVYACRNYGLPLRILFTPWGEALHRRSYQEAIRDLSIYDHVEQVAIQTNLSANLDWLTECRKEKVGLWCSFHPTEVTADVFLEQVLRLRELRVAHSVGMVGLREHFELIEEMRRRLPKETYLWINAYKDEANYYRVEEVQRLERVDPLFQDNLQNYDSLGKRCNTGTRVISVDEYGDVRRCHFIKTVLGNIFRDPLEEMLRDRPCTREICDCYIGYVHLTEWNLSAKYGDHVLTRIPLDYTATNPT